MTTAYDRVPYASRPYPRTHPSHLGALAVAHGARAADPGRARILEIGCGEGANLLPLAAALPDATVWGIDPAATAIDAARRLGAGLPNLSLFPVGVEALPDGPAFDYVVAHGVLSWIPPEARRALWAVLAGRVAPGGVVYLSFNVLPGWSTRAAVADALRRQVGAIADPVAQVAAARALLRELVADAAPGTLWAAVLQAEQRVADAVDDWYLFHDHLAPHHEPFWFGDVVAAAAAAGLRWICDAEPARVPCPSRALAARATDAAEASALGDLLRGTPFREAVFVRDAAATPAAPDPERFAPLSFHARAAPRPDGDALVLRSPDGGSARVTDPAARALVVGLAAAAPASVPFATVARGVDRVVPGTGPERVAALLGELWFGSEVIGARLGDAPVQRALSVRPRVWPWARAEAERGAEVTSLRHERVTLSALERRVASLLDGGRDRAALESALGPAAEDELRRALVRLAAAGLLDG
jgi:SAM-dependent methyltransferase